MKQEFQTAMIVAADLMGNAIDLMTVEQVTQWKGVRSWMERTYSDYSNTAELCHTIDALQSIIRQLCAEKGMTDGEIAELLDGVK